MTLISRTCTVLCGLLHCYTNLLIAVCCCIVIIIIISKPAQAKERRGEELRRLKNELPARAAKNKVGHHCSIEHTLDTASVVN